MLAEFEQRLADVVGARLPAPFTGRVDRAPGPDPSDEVRLIVGVQSTTPLEADFLAHRDVRLPGSTDFKRVVKLRCLVGVEPRTSEGRSGQMAALDAALFVLDAPELRDASALGDGDEDPGFLIERMQLASSQTPLFPNGDAPLAIRLEADGWFWPVGTAEEAGEAIREALVRGGLLPLQLMPPNPRFTAGGEPATLILRLGAVGTMRLRGAEAEPEGLPFGSLALTLRDAGARPGAGSLSGIPGVGDVRLVLLENGEATVEYTPPDAPAVDFLVVALADPSGGQGIELGRFRLATRGG